MNLNKQANQQIGMTKNKYLSYYYIQENWDEKIGTSTDESAIKLEQLETKRS